jgi:uncharacterized membrane protein YkvA (DUF1232 family)
MLPQSSYKAREPRPPDSIITSSAVPSSLSSQLASPLADLVSLTLRIAFLFTRRGAFLGQMKNAKTKSNAEKQSSYQKPVLRSEAFARALREAKLRLTGLGGLRSLFEKATKECASLPRRRFKENWPYLQTMLRLLRAYEQGEYKQVSNKDLLWVVTALNYLVDPFDLIPDTTPFLGFVDDAIVVDFVVDKSRQALDEFMIWETSGAG